MANIKIFNKGERLHTYNKITLFVILIILLGGGVYLLFSKPLSKAIIPDAPNTFIQEINLKIDSLRIASIDVFCVERYKTYENDIKFYAEVNKISPIEKNESLLKLKEVYSALFIRQANKIFSGNVWDPTVLAIIQSEYSKLTPSDNHESEAGLAKIRSILERYNIISNFLNSAYQYTHNARVNSINDVYDIERTNNFINTASIYLNSFSRSLISKCSRLRTQLESIRTTMYQSHLIYINNKVNFCLNKYTSLNSYKEYYKEIYYPIQKEFEEFLNNSTNYSVDNDDIVVDISGAKSRIESDDFKAQNYFNNK